MLRIIQYTSFATLLMLALATPLFAADGHGAQVGDKFSRGLGNAVGGWLEVPKNIVSESRAHNAAIGLTWGTVKGTFHAAGRTAVGAAELGTFFVPNDEIVHPTYAWTAPDQETTYGSR